MTTALHPGLASGRWRDLTLMEQLANIGSEVGRATKAKSIGNDQRFTNALDRCLELFDMTIADDRWWGRRREITRAREVVCAPRFETPAQAACRRRAAKRSDWSDAREIVDCVPSLLRRLLPRTLRPDCRA